MLRSKHSLGLRCTDPGVYCKRPVLNLGKYLVVALSSLILLAACRGESGTEPTALPYAERTEEGKVVWPEFDSIEPAQTVGGSKLSIEGHGGYVQREVEGSTMYDETYRTFKLYLDGEEIGIFACFVNRCEGEVVIPAGTESGEHEISVEGGAIIQIEIISG
jgi:hypothetical protein